MSVAVPQCALTAFTASTSRERATLHAHRVHPLHHWLRCRCCTSCHAPRLAFTSSGWLPAKCMRRSGAKRAHYLKCPSDASVSRFGTNMISLISLRVSDCERQSKSAWRLPANVRFGSKDLTGPSDCHPLRRRCPPALRGADHFALLLRRTCRR